MRRITSFGALAIFALGGSATSSSTASELPLGPWTLRICEGTASTGSTCAFLDQTLKLEVKYGAGAADVGRVLFTQKISHESAQQVFDYALSAVRSFGQTAAGTAGPDGGFFMVHLEVNGHVASVEFMGLSGADDAGPALKRLAELLGRITHAF